MLSRSKIEKFKIAWAKLLCGLIALLILNSSIDTPSNSDIMVWDGADFTEDLSYNDIESIYELLTEEILDLEDFVAEHDNDADDTEKNSKGPQQLLAILTEVYQLPVCRLPKPNYHNPKVSLLNNTLKKHVPPPDALV